MKIIAYGMLIAILVHGREQALALRNMLVKEHLGSGIPANMNNFDNVFNAFKNVVAKNRLPKDTGSFRSTISNYLKRIFY